MDRKDPACGTIAFQYNPYRSQGCKSTFPILSMCRSSCPSESALLFLLIRTKGSFFISLRMRIREETALMLTDVSACFVSMTLRCVQISEPISCQFTCRFRILFEEGRYSAGYHNGTCAGQFKALWPIHHQPPFSPRSPITSRLMNDSIGFSCP